MEGDPGGAGADPDVQSLAARLLAGRVVLCAGSALGGRPSFRSLVEQLLSRLGPDGSEARGLLGSRPLWVSGLVKRRLGEQFQSALAEALRAQTGSGEVDGLCARLPFRAVLSTALDDGIGRALGQAATDGGAASPAVYTAATAERVRSEGRGRYVLQLLGDGVSGRDVLFSEAEIDAALRSDGVRGVLGDLAHKRTLLLLGFDSRDPDLELLLSRVLLPAHSGAAHADGPQHFAVLPGLPLGMAEELEAAYGVRVLREADELGLLRALKAAVGDATGEALPDDDDLLGWLRVLQQEPEQQDAVAKLAAIEQRLTEQKDADRLIELWLGRMEVEASAEGRARCLQKVAALFEHDKGQLAEAFHSLLAAYKESPEPALYAEVERLAGASGSWVELLSALRELVPALPLEQRPEALLRIARLYGDKLSHVEYALASLSEAQRLEVKDAGVRRQMLTLRAELLRRAEKWKDLAETLVQLADALPSGDGASDEGKDKRLDLYLEAGEVYETRLSDGISAAAAYKKGRAVDPTSRDVLAALEHALRRASNWTDLIALLDDKAAALQGDAAGALRARREAAQLHTEHTTERKGSIARWEAVEKAAAEAPETRDVRVEALRALEKLYTAEGGLSDQYLGTLEALADHVPSDKERLTLYRRLVAEHEERVQRPRVTRLAQQILGQLNFCASITGAECNNVERDSAGASQDASGYCIQRQCAESVLKFRSAGYSQVIPGASIVEI